MAVPPSCSMIAAVSSIVSGRPYGERLPRTLRPVQYTIAPASPKARAIPRPAPRVAPATTATCPVSSRADSGDVVTGVVGLRKLGVFFGRAMLVQEISARLPTRFSKPCAVRRAVWVRDAPLRARSAGTKSRGAIFRADCDQANAYCLRSQVSISTLSESSGELVLMPASKHRPLPAIRHGSSVALSSRASRQCWGIHPRCCR